MVQSKRETPGKTPKNEAVKLRTEEDEETAQESTQHEGQDAKQISIEVECDKYTDQSGAEKAEVDQKVAGTAEANEINREDKSTEPKCPEKIVSVKKKRKKNVAIVVAGAESAGISGPETIEVDKFAAEKKSALFVADKPKNEEIVADKPRNEKYVYGEQKRGGQAAKQISIEVECNKYTDQRSGAEKTEVYPKVAGATEANEINGEDESTEPKIPEKMVSAEKNCNKIAAEVMAGTENAGSLAAESVDVDRFAGEQESALVVADKPRNEEYVMGELKKEVIVDSIQIIGKSEQKCVPKAKLEMESPQTAMKTLEVSKADEPTAKKVELQQNESEKEVEVIVKTETKENLSEKMEIDETVDTKIENEQSEGKRKKSKKRKRANKVKEREPQTAKKILEVAKVIESTAKKMDLQQNESEKEIEVTVKTETKQKLSEKMEIDEMVEKKIENEQSEGKRKKSKKRKRDNKVKGGEPQTAKKILEAAKVIESIARKVELRQNESEKEIEVTAKTETKQKLSEKIEIDEMVEKKIENEQSEGKRKKNKKMKPKKKVIGGELKKITDEEGEVKKITQEEVKVKTMKVDGTVEKNPLNIQSGGKRTKSKKKKRAKKVKGELKKITKEEGEVKKITQEERELKTIKVDGTVKKNPENVQSKSKKRNGTNIEKGRQSKKTRQEETAKEEQQKCNAIEVTEMLVDSLTKDELLEVVKSTALEAVGFSAHVDRVASRDELKRTICVKSLSHSTNSEMLRKAFLQYGEIEKAVVVVDEESGHCRGFGFVVFITKLSALRALRDPIKEINGQQCHCLPRNDQRNRSLNSYTAIPRPGKSVRSAINGPGGIVNPTMLAFGEYVDPPVFGPRVNSTFYGHLNPQAALGDFQSPHQWGDSDLQYEYSDSQCNENNQVERCGCGSIYCDL